MQKRNPLYPHREEKFHVIKPTKDSSGFIYFLPETTPKYKEVVAWVEEKGNKHYIMWASGCSYRTEQDLLMFLLRWE
jgi:hypothetical protein